MNLSIERQIELIGALRQLAIESIIETIAKLKKGVTTEHDALNILIDSLVNCGIKDYWYPSGEETGAKQFGCIVVFDTPGYKNRTTFPNARAITASRDIRWEGIGYFYVSPQRITKKGEIIWGDIGSSIYTGNSKVIQSYFKKCWKISESILCDLESFNHLTTRKVHQIYKKYSETQGVRNMAVSKSGPELGAHGINIGHSFPRAVVIDQTIDSENIKISLVKKRKFIDGLSEYTLDGEIWSLEPRDHPDGYPYGTISFHRLFAQIKGKRILLPDCPRIFKAVGMNWIFQP